MKELGSVNPLALEFHCAAQKCLHGLYSWPVLRSFDQAFLHALRDAIAQALDLCFFFADHGTGVAFGKEAAIPSRYPASFSRNLRSEPEELTRLFTVVWKEKPMEMTAHHNRVAELHSILLLGVGQRADDATIERLVRRGQKPSLRAFMFGFMQMGQARK